MHGHGLLRGRRHARRVAVPALLPLGDAPAAGQVAVQRVVSGGLVGHDIGPHASPHQLGENVRRIAQQPDRHGPAFRAGGLDDPQGLVQIRRLHVQITRAQPHLDPARLALHGQHAGARHRCRQRLRAAHATEPGGQNPAALEAAAIMLPAGLHEGFIRALNDSLAADINPRPGGHLPIHHEAPPIEFVEMLPGRPMRHQVRIRDQHTRCIGMGAEHADRLAGLHQQSLVPVQPAQAGDDAVETVPIPRGPSDAAVHDQFLRPLRDLRVQIVHQHPQRRFGLPGFRRQHRPAVSADVTGIVQPGHVRPPYGSGRATRRPPARGCRSWPSQQRCPVPWHDQFPA